MPAVYDRVMALGLEARSYFGICMFLWSWIDEAARKVVRRGINAYMEVSNRYTSHTW